MELIEIESLSKAFVTGKRLRHLLFPKRVAPSRLIYALREVTLSIGEGEWIGLMGPNGAGKTTLIKILAGLILPDNGTVRICGFPFQLARQVKKTVGLVTGDERSFYWRLTGKQNLEFFASLHQLSSKNTKKRILDLCEQMQIENPDRPFQEYSSGLKQRFALARALLHDPPVLLLDEPIRSLDRKTSEQLLTLIKQLVEKQKKTVIYATHQMQEAASLFDRVFLLREGKLIKDGKWAEVEKEFLC